MATSQDVHKDPTIGSHVLPYRETDTRAFGFYLWWAFCWTHPGIIRISRTCNFMKKNLSWKILIPLGVVCILIGRLVQGGVITDAIGVLGDIVFLLGAVNLIATFYKNKKAKQTSVPESVPTTKNTAKTFQKMSVKVIGGIVGILAFIGAYVGARYLTEQGVSAVTNTPSKQEIIHQAVDIANSQTTFPQELDAITIFTGIKEDTGAIRYEYVLHDLDGADVSDVSLRNMLTPSVCQNQSTRALLNKDINLEYAYQVRNSSDTYFVVLNKSNCN